MSPDNQQGYPDRAEHHPIDFVAPEALPFPEPAEDAYIKYHDPDTFEVHVKSHLTLEDYEKVTPNEEWAQLLELARQMEGKKVVRINATAAGGGVAIMNSPWVHLMSSLGVDAHWYALKPNEKAAEVTKWKFHNVLQDVGEPDAQLTDEDKDVYNEWIKENAGLLEAPLREADVILLDDWQPSGLIQYIKGYEEPADDGSVFHMGFNPNAPIMFRDHIHTEGELMVKTGTRQNITWDFLWDHNRIKEADVFVTHPKDEFVPPDVPNEKVVFMPATADVLDDLNREITEQEQQAGLAFINEQLAMNQDQLPLDMNRPYIVLIARFDESKGMPEGIESYAKARAELLNRGVEENQLPQFVVLGNGSVDDPSGTLVLEEIMDLRAKEYGAIQHDLKVVRVPHNDVAINALLKGAKLALQPSTKEGFESRVTDAILQGVPVIGSDRGGIPLQIVHGESGFIADPYDTDRWSDYIADLTTNSLLYEYMQQRTRELAESNNYRFTTVPNLIRWLQLSHRLLTNPDEFQGNRRWVEDLAA